MRSVGGRLSPFSLGRGRVVDLGQQLVEPPLNSAREPLRLLWLQLSARHEVAGRVEVSEVLEQLFEVAAHLHVCATVGSAHARRILTVSYGASDEGTLREQQRGKKAQTNPHSSVIDQHDRKRHDRQHEEGRRFVVLLFHGSASSLSGEDNRVACQVPVVAGH